MAKEKLPKVIIDPGHGGKDPGGGTNEYWQEKNMNLKISLYQYDRLKELGVPVEITRTKDEYLPWRERTKRVKESGAKFCISNHINAGGGEGAVVIHSIHTDGKLASMILDKIKEAGQKVRRVYTRSLPGKPGTDYYYMNRETGAVETVIVEYGFADHPADAKRINAMWKSLAEAALKGFLIHIGYKYERPEEESEKEEIPKWKKDPIDWMFKAGLLTSQEWKEKINEPLPLWAEAIVLKRLEEKIIKEIIKAVKGEK